MKWMMRLTGALTGVFGVTLLVMAVRFMWFGIEVSGERVFVALAGWLFCLIAWAMLSESSL